MESSEIDTRSRQLFRLSVGVFFSGGFVAAILSLLVPRLRDGLSLGYGSATLVQLATHSSYLVLALPIASIISASGYMRAHALGLLLMALGLVGVVGGFAGASFAAVFSALCLVSAGATFLQIASNTAVTLVGDPARAAIRLNVLQGLNSLGTVLGPLLGSAFILAPVERTAPAGMLFLPFGGAAILLLALSVTFWRHRDLLRGTVHRSDTAVRQDWSNTLRRPRLIGGVLAIFAYVGAEVTIGALLTDFLRLPGVLGLSAVAAGRLVAFYWLGAMIGRFAGAALLNTLSAQRLLIGAACGAIGFGLVAMLSAGAVAAAALIGIGLFNSIMYPTIYVLALPTAAAEATPGATMLCMAVVGGAVIPVVTGFAADTVGLMTALLLPIACYGVVAAFAGACRDGRIGLLAEETLIVP